MIDQDLKETLQEKIEDGEFGIADIPAYLTLFCQMGNEMEELQEEVAGWDLRINLNLGGAVSRWITIEDGHFAAGEGALDDSNLALFMDAADAAQIFAGDMDTTAAYLSGVLRIEGELPDAVKMQALIEIVGEEIEY